MKAKYLIMALAFIVSVVDANAKDLGNYSSSNGKKKVLVVGGGSSHNFDRWYKNEDTKLINSIKGVEAFYTDNTDSIRFYLKDVDLLVLSNNQTIPKTSQLAIEQFVSKGKPLILLHAAVWYNWNDWPNYNQEFVGGGSQSHENFQEFDNRVVNSVHPINNGVSESFSFKDELYRHVFDPKGKGVNVLVVGKSKETDKIYPVVYTVEQNKSRIVGITLGHDENSHLDKDYRKILTNSVSWALKL